MELRVLRYFLAVAREQNITRAAEALHVTQPTLSKQLMDLEEELGQKLFVRGKRKVTLTEAGEFLRRRAQEIAELADKTEEAFRKTDGEISGNIWIACGETEGMRILVRAMKKTARAFSRRPLPPVQRERCGRRRPPGQGSGGFRAVRRHRRSG